jgi:CHAT domain-containing protein
MGRFYGYLKDGQPKDRALRSAQIDLITGKAAPESDELRHPFHWAAFELIGDWR